MPGPSGSLAGRRLRITARLLAAALVLVSTPALAAARPTDYEIELAQIRKDIDEVRDGAFAAPIDVGRATRLVFLLYRFSSLTASFADFRSTETAIDKALELVGPSEDLILLRANLDFKLHRLARTKADLAMVPDLAGSAGVKALRADLDLQEGRYEEARRGYEKVVEQGRTSSSLGAWDNLARLAYLETKTGDVAGGLKLYREAQDEITAKEMRSYAWVELQDGLLDFDSGRYDKALAHYRRAARAYSGYWLIEEHMAEVLDLLGHTGEAIDLYRRVIERTQNPEYVGALAVIVDRRDHAAAEIMFQEADRLFRERYALYPEAAIGHFIRYMIARKDAGPELLEMAEKNYRLRPNADSKLLLARAYFKLHRTAEASALVDEILATPWRTPEIARFSRLVRASR
ncbi:MAG TPA: tetratricopeptide repeat protein [Thermoanaerobaculia bacterium]|nr:tetratricopeptide repeat protein [Thermoanaerobaculia bacterium]